MRVDWAGNTLDIYDPVTGDVSKAWCSLSTIPLKNMRFGKVYKKYYY